MNKNKNHKKNLKILNIKKNNNLKIISLFFVFLLIFNLIAFAFRLINVLTFWLIIFISFLFLKLNNKLIK